MGNDVAKQAVSPLVGAVAAVQGKNKLRSVFGSKPAAGSIVFVGSQTFQNWDSLKKDMHGLPVVNCGFVGAMSKHLWGAPEQPFETFKRALREFRGVHPELPVVYVSPIVTPHHKDLGQALCQKFARLHRLVADYATGDALLYVVDVNDKAFSTDAFNYEVDRTRLTAGGNRLLAADGAGKGPDAKANEIVMECLDDHVATHVPDDDVHHHVAEPSPSRANSLARRLEPRVDGFTCMSPTSAKAMIDVAKEASESRDGAVDAGAAAAADAAAAEEEPKAEPPAPPPVPIEGLDEDPRGPAKAAAPEEPLPETPPYPLAAGDDDDPWEEKFDEHSGLPYFVHRVTGESAWDKPGAELCTEDAYAEAPDGAPLDDLDDLGSEESVYETTTENNPGAWGTVVDSKPDEEGETGRPCSAR
ncbi:hypothetical protein JL721_10302 [Aureococcus anophagefferens]|nr:hypothetical protein JL721_10302 [Aureococcus anophagefferens]